MQALLSVMALLHAPVEQNLETIDAYFSADRTPDHFVPYLASWVDLDRFFIKSGIMLESKENPEPLPTGQGRLRELIGAASYLSQWRGTARGLKLFLETATGEREFIIDENVRDESGALRTFHFKVTAPAAAKNYRRLIEHIIEQEKPAYVSFELHFSD